MISWFAKKLSSNPSKSNSNEGLGDIRKEPTSNDNIKKSRTKSFTESAKRKANSPNLRGKLHHKSTNLPTSSTNDNDFDSEKITIMESYRRRASSAKKENDASADVVNQNSSDTPPIRIPEKRPSSRSGTPNSSSHKLGGIYFKNTLAENRSELDTSKNIHKKPKNQVKSITTLIPQEVSEAHYRDSTY